MPAPTYFVYMVRCADGTLYTGYARDPRKREKVHNSGRGAHYTACRLPVSLVYSESCPSKSEALKREIQLKRLTRAKKEALAKATHVVRIRPSLEYNRAVKTDRASKKEKRAASDADIADFERAMTGVVRLTPDPRGRVRAAPEVTGPRAASSRRSPAANEGTDDSDSADFVASGVDRRELRKLKRGEHAPGCDLDLHGQTAVEAVASVKQFIEQSRHRHRCVRIVHGRGLHSKDNVSILRAPVRACLRQHRSVLAYADAPRADGGTGAVHVLLRK